MVYTYRKGKKTLGRKKIMIKSNYVCVFIYIYKNREKTRKSIRNSKDMFQIKFSFFQQILAL